MRELADWPPGLGAAHGCAPGAQLKITALMTAVHFPACAEVMGADARYYLGRSLWD
jgi:hypothetical protein